MPRISVSIVTRAAVVVAALSVCASLVGCGGPPMLSKADLDAGKTPKKHPRLTELQIKNGCRSCHRERPAGQPAK